MRTRVQCSETTHSSRCGGTRCSSRAGKLRRMGPRGSVANQPSLPARSRRTERFCLKKKKKGKTPKELHQRLFSGLHRHIHITCTHKHACIHTNTKECITQTQKNSSKKKKQKSDMKRFVSHLRSHEAGNCRELGFQLWLVCLEQ